MVDEPFLGETAPLSADKGRLFWPWAPAHWRRADAAWVFRSRSIGFTSRPQAWKASLGKTEARRGRIGTNMISASALIEVFNVLRLSPSASVWAAKFLSLQFGRLAGDKAFARTSLVCPCEIKNPEFQRVPVGESLDVLHEAWLCFGR